MDRRESVAGKYGAKVRSDCRVTFRPGTEGGIALTVESKVATMYGGEIERLAREVLASLGVDHGEVTIEDRGALPFTLAARIETAVRRSLGEVPPWLPPMRKENAFEACTTQRERFRRSRLYLPGNEPKFFINAGLYQADGIILDLEDSVAPAEKDAARILVRNALRAVDFKGSERMVRINPPPLGFEDLEAVVPHNVHVVLIPKCESAEDVTAVARRIEAIREAEGIAAPVYLMPIVESARGVLAALEIAEASPLVVALTIGLEDYTADIGCARTPEGKESLWARSMIVHAARAAGIQPIDSVFSDVADMSALRESVREAKSLGFEGKGCIHPRQIAVIHEAFAPTAEEIERAVRIVRAYEAGVAEGSGVVTLGTKMIDPPVVKRAERTVRMAVEMGLLPETWREEVEQDA